MGKAKVNSFNSGHDTAQKIINMQWFVAATLVHGQQQMKIEIMAGCADPRIGTPVMDTRELYFTSNNIAQAENLARYVVELHNRNLANETNRD